MALPSKTYFKSAYRTCNHCNAPIALVRSKSGKTMILEPTPGIKPGQVFNHKLHSLHECPNYNSRPQETHDASVDIRPEITKIISILTEVREMLVSLRTDIITENVPWEEGGPS